MGVANPRGVGRLSERLATDAESDQDGILNLMQAVVGERPADGSGFEHTLVQTGNLFALRNRCMGETAFLSIQQDVGRGWPDLRGKRNDEDIAGPPVPDIGGQDQDWAHLPACRARAHGRQVDLSAPR